MLKKMILKPKNTWNNFAHTSELWGEILEKSKGENYVYINPCSGVFILESKASGNLLYFEYNEDENIQKVEVQTTSKEDDGFTAFLNQLKQKYDLA